MNAVLLGLLLHDLVCCYAAWAAAMIGLRSLGCQQQRLARISQEKYVNTSNSNPEFFTRDTQVETGVDQEWKIVGINHGRIPIVIYCQSH